ncbi:MAG: hypothetical protein ACLTE2_01780 [Eubacteriales bacterium]
MYARIMLMNMAGNRSEMSLSSTASYTYNQLITDEHKEIAEMFHKIVLNVSSLLLALWPDNCGADPRLWTSRHNRAVYCHPDLISIPKHFRN